MLLIYIILLLAALMTVAGGWIYVKLNHRYPASIEVFTGLSAGFLISLIFIGIIPEAKELISASFQDRAGWILPLSVIAGTLLIVFFEKIVPVEHHHDIEAKEVVLHSKKDLFYVVLAAFGIHSLFEFLSVLIAGKSASSMGIVLAIVIGIHNIPIGFIIMAQLKAIGAGEKQILHGTFVLALCETGAAILIFLLLSQVMNQGIQGILLGATGGVMLYLLFDELFPQVYNGKHQHRTNFAVIAGVLTMLLFLQFFNV